MSVLSWRPFNCCINWVAVLNRGGGGGSVLPYRYVPTIQRVGYRLCSLWSGVRYGFWGKYGSLRTYFVVSISNEKERENCEFKMDLRNLVFVVVFLLLINLSNNYFLEARSENGCKKWHFLVWNRVRIWRTERRISTKNPQEYSPWYWRSRFVFVSALNFKSSLLSAIYTGFTWYSRIKWYTWSAGRPGATRTPGKGRCKRTNWW